VANLVSDLTNPPYEKGIDRSQRAEIYRNHSQGISPRAKTIKLNDIIHNLSDRDMVDPNWLRVYMGEKSYK
jgi:hypothetical protein